MKKCSGTSSAAPGPQCAAAVLALAMTFSMGAPLALAAQPEESTAAVTETVQEADMPHPAAGDAGACRRDPEAPPVQATEAEENSTNQHTPENSVVLTPEEIRAALDAGAMDAAEAQCIDLSDENGFFSWLFNFLFGWLGKRAIPGAGLFRLAHLRRQDLLLQPDHQQAGDRHPVHRQ